MTAAPRSRRCRTHHQHARRPTVIWRKLSLGNQNGKVRRFAKVLLATIETIPQRFSIRDPAITRLHDAQRPAAPLRLEA